LIGGVRDITEQREFEDLRREAQKLEAIGQLSAGVAHNFNNMLTGIIPNIELALEGATPEVGELLRAAQDAALRASELVGQLVTFAGRAQAGPRRAEDMRGLVQRAVEMCRRTFDRSIELTTRLPGTEQLVVAAATELEQVLLNLLINARDAVSSLSIATPQVEVSVDVARLDGAALRRLGLAERDEYVRIQVRDNGVGIPEEDQTRIFEPFYTTKDPGRGTGLGLSTTLTTVREHGGAVECHSAQGVGSTFTVYLPSAPQKISRKPSSIPPARGGSETILLIDDEPAVRDVVERMLTRIGYRVEVASSGVDGLAMLENPALRDAVSLVIVDMSMPGLPGRVVCERLKQLYPRLRVAYFTGYAVESLEGADGVIHKPVTNEGLARSLRAILDGHGDSDRRGA
jgi:nitrogen-specific signal transduction histidine kinase